VNTLDRNTLYFTVCNGHAHAFLYSSPAG